MGIAFVTSQVAHAAEGLGNASVQKAVAQIVAQVDAGGDASSLILPAADLGIEAAIECSRHIDAAHPARNAVLLEVIAQAGQSRRSNSEMLELYDPAAYRLFYLDDGAADQKLIGKALDLKVWPPKLPEAMVRAAPLATLQWMADQATAEHPRTRELVDVWQAWGFWAKVGHERQYLPKLGAAVGPFTRNAAFLSDEHTLSLLIRFAGNVKARDSIPFIVQEATEGPFETRVEAIFACARFSDSDDAKKAILKVGRQVVDYFISQKVAVAAGAWPESTEVGEMAAALFEKNKSVAVRREILFSCSEATWPVRADLLTRAFDVPDDGVLGAALLALASHPEPKALQRVLELAAITQDAQPPLIDALAAYGDARAVPHLVRWLDQQKSPVVRVKLLLALEKASKHEADALLLRILTEDPSAMVVEQTLGIAARKQIAEAEPILAALVKDATAPMQVRISAIAGLGDFNTPDAGRTLDGIERDTSTIFKGADGKAADPEAISMARLMAALAKVQRRDPKADAQLQAAYDRGSGMAQLTALIMLAQMGRDHAVIAQGLATTDTAVLFGAVRAAEAADPVKYHDRLVAVREAPFINALLNSGLDSANLRSTLDEAIRKGEKR